MKWYKDLYIGDSLQKNKDKVIRRVMQNVLQPGLYLITLARNEQDNFVVLPSMVLLQRNFNKDDLLILGIAKGQDECNELIVDMIADALKEYDIDNIKKYFTPRGSLK